MSKSSRHYTVRLPRELYAQLEAEARRRGCCHADLTREALEHFLRGQSFIADSDLRLRRICEYAQLALDTIIKEDHPDYRDVLLTETSARMERYHGTR